MAKPGGYVNTSWVFYLEPVDERTTRLIERFRTNYTAGLTTMLFNRMILEPGRTIRCLGVAA